VSPEDNAHPKSPTSLILAVVALALCCASTAPAQSVADASAATVAPQSDGRQTLKLPVLVWAAGVAADQMTTYRFSSQYRDMLHESNPLVHGLDRRPLLLVTAGTAIDVATGWAAYRFLGSRHPRLAKVAFYGAAAYRSYLAFYNIQAMRRAQNARAPVSAP
jgi:hypothetical protein